MGANAQTTVPTFTASQVLTADQMNQSARTGIPVFSSTVTRDAGFGGTGEKTLAEGQLCYVEGTGLQSYNGSSWVTWGAAPSAGLNVVKAETSFSATNTINADSVFTSSYTNYIVTVRASAASGTNIYWALRVGGVTANTNYNTQELTGNGASASASRLTSQTRAVFGAVGTNIGFIHLWLSGPQLAAATAGISSGTYGESGGIILWQNATDHTTATAYDGIAITADANITGTYTIYGLGEA